MGMYGGTLVIAVIRLIMKLLWQERQSMHTGNLGLTFNHIQSNKLKKKEQKTKMS